MLKTLFALETAFETVLDRAAVGFFVGAAVGVAAALIAVAI